MKRRMGKALSLLTALTVVVSCLTGLGIGAYAAEGDETAVLAAAPRVIYTYEGTEAEIFDGVNMVDWAHSHEYDETAGVDDTMNPMFDQNTWTFEGQDITTLKRQRNYKWMNNGKKAWITYKVDQMKSFSVDFIFGNESGKVPDDATFQICTTDNYKTDPESGTTDAQFTDIAVTKTGSAPSTSGSYARVNYTATDIPDGVKYLRITFPGLPSASSAGFLTVQLEKVVINPQQTPEEELIDFLQFENLSDQNQKAVTEDLTLPTSGPAGQTITWESSDTSALTNDGQITRKDADTKVTLTAKSSYDNGDGAVDYEQSYEITILRSSLDGMLIDPCNDDSLTYDTSEHIQYTVLQDAGGEQTVTCQDGYISGTEYLTYHVDGMCSFEFDIVENTRGGDKVPRIYTSSDGQRFYEFFDFRKTDSIPYENNPHGGWSRASYIADSLPDGTNYIRIYFGAQQDGRYWSFGFDEIRLAYREISYAYEWPENASVALSNITTDGVTLTWPAAVGDNLTYQVYQNYELVTTTEATTYTASGLMPNTQYKYSVRAVNKNDASQFSQELLSDDVLTQRDNRGQKLELSLDEGQTAITLPTAGGEIINASGVLHISANAMPSYGNKVKVGFGDDTYIEFTGYDVQYYKKGTLIRTMDRRTLLDDISIPFTTEDFLAGENAVLSMTTTFPENANVTVTWSDIEIYQVEDPGTWYENTNEINMTESYSIDLENDVPKNFTLETDVYIAGDAQSDVTLTLTSSADNKRIASFNLSARKADDTFSNVRTYYETGDKTDKHYNYLKYLYLPVLQADAWQNVKLYVDFENYYIQLYVNNVLAAENMLFVNDQSPDLHNITFTPTGENANAKIKNIKVSSGYSGLFFNPVTVVDEEGNDLPLLTPGENVTLRLEALNATDSSREFVMITQQNDSYTAPAATESPLTLPNDGQWHQFDKTVVAEGANDNIKAFIWDSVDGMQPLTQAGGYIGTPNDDKKEANIFLIGDSTVFYTNNDKVGWGEVLNDYLKDSATLYNLARDGISSKTYLESGRLNVISSKVKEGDYIFFQLAHNDRNPNSENYKGTTIEEYKENLRKYVAFAKSKGANFIFVTPACLFGDVQNAVNNGNSVDAAVNASSLKNYAVAMEEVAAELDVPIIDLWRTSIGEFAALGLDYTRNNIYWPSDGTHFTEEGAKALAEMVRDLLREQNLEPISYFK